MNKSIEPLDLCAVEAHLEWPNGAPRDELLALLAALRETRAMLHHVREYAEEIERATPPGDAHGCAQNIQREVTAVLASVIDENADA